MSARTQRASGWRAEAVRTSEAPFEGAATTRSRALLAQPPFLSRCDPGRSAMTVDESLRQLLFLLWNRADREVTDEQAFALYESHPQWVQPAIMTHHERTIFEALLQRFGRGVYLG